MIGLGFVARAIGPTSLSNEILNRWKSGKQGRWRKLAAACTLARLWAHTSKADISHRLDHYVAFVARMCSILKKLGVEDSRIEEAKDMVARKIECQCELNDRAINPPRA